MILMLFLFLDKIYWPRVLSCSRQDLLANLSGQFQIKVLQHMATRSVMMCEKPFQIRSDLCSLSPILSSFKLLANFQFVTWEHLPCFRQCPHSSHWGVWLSDCSTLDVDPHFVPRYLTLS